MNVIVEVCHRAATSLAGAVLAASVSSGGAALAADASLGNPRDPVRLTGKWTFTSSSSLRHYGGDIVLRLAAAEPDGTRRGWVSYDGRQTNDRCSTKSGFSADEPVDASASFEGSALIVQFLLRCPIGESPRAFKWTLVRGEDGSYAEELAHMNGSGRIRLVRAP